MSRKIQSMFNNIAADYDKMNRVMTFGMDSHWRRYVIKEAGLFDEAILLDLATGTGDIIFEALRHNKVRATGLDFSESMLEIARERDITHKAVWIKADALDLPFENDSFDALTSGYLMRNVDSIEKAFSEQYRVLKKEGRVVCLDTTPPVKNLLRPFINIYLKRIIPLIGKVLTKNPSAYAYLIESTVNFKNTGELKEIMIQCGFKEIKIQKFMFGTMAVHSAVK